jgi:hypothetical protein
MIRIGTGLALAMAAAVWSAGASAQVTNAQVIGAWTCSGTVDGVTTAGAMVYKADGTSTFDMTITGSASGVLLDVKAQGDATWKLTADGRLGEKFTRVTVPSGTIGGSPVDPAMKAMLEQSLLETPMAPSPLIFAGPNNMTVSDGNGGGTKCTR